MNWEVAEITARSLLVSGSATLLSSAWSIPLAFLLAKSDGRISRIMTSILEALVGIPTVLVGLLLYMLLSSSGPLAPLRLLYTPAAIVVGQSILITPLMISVVQKVLSTSWAKFGELAISLGATDRQAALLTISESIQGIMASVVMGFSRALGELGVALMVGGNIRGHTRVMTTAIALEISKGEYELAIGLGVVLLSIILMISISLRLLWRFGE